MVGIISNNAAIFAQRNLASASTDSTSSIAKLSSGNRIIRAADDVAGLAVGTSLSTDVSTLRTVLSTTNQASSLLAVADAGLNEISSILQRQKALAVSANSGSLSDTERAFLQQEFGSLQNEIDRITSSTQFNGIKLLDGSVSGAAGLTTNNTAGDFSLDAIGDYSAAEDTAATNTYTPATIEGSAATAVTFAVAQTGGTQEVEAIGFTGATTQALSHETSTKVFDGTTVGATLESTTFTLTAIAVDGETVIIDAGGDNITLTFDAVATADITAGTVSIGAGINESAANLAAAIQYQSDQGNLPGGGGYDVTVSGAVVTITAKTEGVNGGPNALITGTSISEGTNSSTTANTVGIAGETFILDGNTYTYVAAGQGNDFANNKIEVGAASVTAANTAAQINFDNTAGGNFTDPITASTGGGATLTVVTNTAEATTQLAITGTEGSTVTNVAGLASDILTIAGVAFTFVEAADGSSSGVVIREGASEADTLVNIVEHLNDSSTNGGAGGARAATVGLFSYAVSGNDIIATAKVAAVDGGLTFDNNNAVAGNLAGLAVTGVASTAVTTPTYQTSLQGAISDISGTFIASDANNNARVQLSAVVGGVTYLSNLHDLGSTPEITGGETLTFTSQASTGATDVTFSIVVEAALADFTLASQTNADTFANNLQADFDGTGFVINQAREISSYTASATDGTVLQGLTAAQVTIQADSFDSAGGFGSLEAFNVDAANNRITTTVGGEVYTADLTVYNAGAGTYDSSAKLLTTNSTLTFTSASLTDARSIQLDLNTSVIADSIDISSSSGEAALESVLNGAFDIGGGSGLVFQVGTEATDTIGVTLAGANTSTLFVDADGASVSLDISSAGVADTSNGGDGTGSILASNVIDRAINSVTSLRATVGALQSRFDFAASSIGASIQNLDAARSSFLEADIADESTTFATAQVRLQASISVLAQANQLPQNLLKLIG